MQQMSVPMLKDVFAFTVADFLNDHVIPLFDSYQMLMRLLDHGS